MPSMAQMFSSEINLGSVRDVDDSSPFVRQSLIGNESLKAAEAESINIGLTYEINNSSVNFQEFNKQYETTFDVLHYIDIRPSGSNNSYAPPDNYRVIGRWPVGNVRLFNITTNSYVTIYPPTTDGSGNEYVRSGAWENLEPSITANERLAGTVADTNYSFSEWVEDGGYINHYRYIQSMVYLDR